MAMPVNRLKLLAFMFGAAIAGLTGHDLRGQPDGVSPATSTSRS